VRVACNARLFCRTGVACIARRGAATDLPPLRGGAAKRFSVKRGGVVCVMREYVKASSARRPAQPRPPRGISRRLAGTAPPCSSVHTSASVARYHRLASSNATSSPAWRTNRCATLSVPLVRYKGRLCSRLSRVASSIRRAHVRRARGKRFVAVHGVYVQPGMKVGHVHGPAVPRSAYG